jgi:hypothetical protein
MMVKALVLPFPSKKRSNQTFSQAVAAVQKKAPSDNDSESFGEFLADFDAVKDKEQVKTETKRVSNGFNSIVAAEEGGTEPESLTTSKNQSADRSTHSEEETVEGETSKDNERSSRKVTITDTSNSEEEEEEVTRSDMPTSDRSTTDAATEGGEEEVAVKPETMPSTESTAESVTDFAAYEKVPALLRGMKSRTYIGRRHSEWCRIQASRQDAILAGFKSLLLHPDFYKDGQLHKHESDALRAWIKAQDLGLLAQVEAGNAWAQLLKGMFRHAKDKDYASAKEYSLRQSKGMPWSIQPRSTLFLLLRGKQHSIPDISFKERMYSGITVEIGEPLLNKSSC